MSEKILLPEGSQIIGKIYSTDSSTAILYGIPADIFLPVLSAFDSSGKEMQKIELLDYHSCVDDPLLQGNTVGKITREYRLERTITLIRFNENNLDSPQIGDTTSIKEIVSLKFE